MTERRARGLGRGVGRRRAASGVQPTPEPAAQAMAPAQVANYIAEMLAGLEIMAGGARLDLLSYFLRMARSESLAAAREKREEQTEIETPSDPRYSFGD